MEDSSITQADFNASEREEPSGPCNFSSSNSVSLLLSTYIFPIICILGFMGNVVIIITLTFKTKHKLETVEVFQLNLAITNLLFTVALAFLIYNELLSWPMGQAACKLLQGSHSINLYSGMLLVAGMSVLHFICICSSLNSQINLKQLKHTVIVCASIWVCAVLFSVPTFYFYQLYEPTSDMFYMLEEEEHSNSSASPRFVCEFQFKDQDLSQIVKVAVPSVQMAVGFFLPLLTIIFCYICILIKLLTHKFNLTDTENKKHDDIQMEAVKTVTGIMLVFVACHLPHNLILLYDTITMFQEMACEEADRWRTALSITEFIAYLQCCLNPVMYGFIGHNFRQKFKQKFTEIFCSDKSQHEQHFNQMSTKRTSISLHHPLTHVPEDLPVQEEDECGLKFRLLDVL